MKLFLLLSLLLSINCAFAESKSCISAAKKGHAANSKGLKHTKKAKKLFDRVEKDLKSNITKGCNTLAQTKATLKKAKSEFQKCMSKFESASRSCSRANSRTAGKNVDICERSKDTTVNVINYVDDLTKKICNAE